MGTKLVCLLICSVLLVRVHNDILKAVDDESVILLLLQLSGAFDIKHTIMVSRLANHFGIRVTALNKWFHSVCFDLSLRNLQSL